MSIACVASMYVRAAVASLWEVAMLSAPVFDSCEGPKQQGAIADAIFEKKFSPRTLHPKTFFPETASTLRRAGPHCL